jgi:hypothetical protein
VELNPDTSGDIMTGVDEIAAELLPEDKLEFVGTTR